MPTTRGQRSVRAHPSAGGEFLYETSLFPELEYTFKHALTHEVAYGGLLHERRRALHARIVEAMEQRYAERLTEQVEQLAHHALRGEVWEKVLFYCRQAGTKALARRPIGRRWRTLSRRWGPSRISPTVVRGEQAIDVRLTSALRWLHLEKWAKSLHTYEKPNCSLRPWAINVG